MTLKNKAALAYLLPLVLTYVSVVAVVSAGRRPEWTDILASALPASALLVGCHLLQDLLGKPFKEFLVFYRVKSRLPGHRAFSKHCVDDPRVPAGFLSAKLEALGDDPAAQNSEWYAMYRGVSKEAPVEHENLRYLAWRDATATLVLLTIATAALQPLGILSWSQVGQIAAGCLVVALLTAAAARNAANSLVRNVVAISACGSADSPME